jgi:hypothetical protein
MVHSILGPVQFRDEEERIDAAAPLVKMPLCDKQNPHWVD